MGNPYLISAYAFTALLFGLYAWNLAHRKAQARRDIKALTKKVSGQ